MTVRILRFLVRPAVTLALAALASACSTAALARDFRAEGVDAGVGLGARYVAQGGTGVAFADDVYALYYNPAGLAGVKGLQLSVTRQLDARMHPFSFVGAAWQLPLAPSWGLDATVAAAFYPRIHARASGAFERNEVESIFLRFLLPGINGTFDGDIDSKTKSYRIALGVAPSAKRRWAVGAYLERIDCQSRFCGVHATSNGYTESSTDATALGYGLGLRWQPADAWTAALAISDLRTELDVSTISTDAAGTRTRLWRAQFPRKLALELSHQFSSQVRWAVGYEVMRGAYGDNSLDIQILRAGWERTQGAWVWRAGALVPLRVSSADTGRLKLPAPLAPTLGLGWRQGAWAVDAAVYAHPVMTLHKDRVSPTADLSLTLGF
ncbi:MAG: hypothetical protein JNJ71_09610 [Rubrivivax sp.]|nr:hypothetical protein [Rubrivivax sp.]